MNATGEHPRGGAHPPSIRTALIGYGYAGKTFHAPLIRATPGLDLVAVVSSDAVKVQRDLADVEVLADAISLLAREDIQLIVIATPNATHAPLASGALRQGRHVVVDKPLALDLVETRALIALAETFGRLLSVFQNRRYDSDFLAVKAAIAGGLVGRVTQFESHIDRYRPQVRERWREQAGAGAGIWYDLGPHLIDQALQLFGLPRRVSAQLAIQRSGGHSEDWAHVLLDYGPRQVILHASMLVAGGVPRFTVHGEAGSLIKMHGDQQEAQLKAGMRPGDPSWGIDPDPLVAFDADGSSRQLVAPGGDCREYYRAIREAILGNAHNPVPTIEALAVMAVLEAAFNASRSGRSSALPLTGAEVAAWETAHASGA